jgi:purine-binding chemotaxis protein CheW
VLVSPEPSELFCTFYVDGLYFGVDVMQVQEVIRYQEMTGVPRAPEIVRGLINLRGQIVTAIDLRRRLGIEDESADLPMNVVIRSGDEAVSLLVDEIGDVVETDPADREDPPPTLTGPARDLVSATYKLPGRLLLILDVDRALTPELVR